MKRKTPIMLKYLPHGLDDKIFKPLDKDDKNLKEFKDLILQGKEAEFILFFNSRNIRRKQIPDTMWAFKIFLDSLPEEDAKKCFMVLHTEIINEHGTDLLAVKDYLFADYPDNVLFSTNRLTEEQMNMLYNVADATILLTSNEGWGLALTESLLSATPIIANVQGGMQDQMRFEDENGDWIDFNEEFPSNHRGTYQKHGKWAFPVFPSNISIQGSPKTPYITDDRCRPEDAAKQIEKLYNMKSEERKELGKAGMEWAKSDEAGFTKEKMADRFIDAMESLFDKWEPREEFNFINATEYKPERSRTLSTEYKTK